MIHQFYFFVVFTLMYISYVFEYKYCNTFPTLFLLRSFYLRDLSTTLYVHPLTFFTVLLIFHRNLEIFFFFIIFLINHTSILLIDLIKLSFYKIFSCSRLGYSSFDNFSIYSFYFLFMSLRPAFYIIYSVI